MKTQILLDTGPLVALLNRRDTYHSWAVDQWQQLAPPLLTCEAVLVEASHLLRATSTGGAPVLALVEQGVVEVPFRLAEHAPQVARIMARYRTLPISLADACLIRMCETVPGSTLLTLDPRFSQMRQSNRRRVPMLIPEALGE